MLQRDRMLQRERMLAKRPNVTKRPNLAKRAILIPSVREETCPKSHIHPPEKIFHIYIYIYISILLVNIIHVLFTLMLHIMLQ